jgi:hypothetical protein
VSSRPARWERGTLGLILVAYLGLACAYALGTPPWQAPDEPAHFNYVRQLAAHPLDLPEIAPGDWPNDYLERLKASGFPPGADISHIEYEDHQAPAWYYLAVPAFWAAGGPDERRLLALRLFNVLVGALGVWLAWCFVRAGWPDDPRLALAAAGFVAYLPMRLTVSASASNDPLAEVVSTAALMLALARATGRLGLRRWVWRGGLLLALAFLTKVSAYGAAGILAAGEGVAWWRRGRLGTTLAASTVGQIWLIGLAGALPWFLRNAAVYGAGDYLGRAAHDRVVVGQPTTAVWLAQHGLWGAPDALLQRMVTWTFDSFWGVFGWMGVFLDRRLYALLALACLVTLAGLAGYLWRRWHDQDARRGDELAAVSLAALAIAAAGAGFLWWNATFVQHQGRYLFPALAAIAALFSLGLREVAGRTARAIGQGRRAHVMETLVLAGFDLALAALAWISLVRYIGPQLR